MTIVKITSDMFANMDYDTVKETTAIGTTDELTKVKDPTVMIVFSDSDLNASSYHLAQSLQNPFATNAITTVLVQESVLDDFTAKVQEKLLPYQPPAVLNEKFAKMLHTISQLKAKTIRPKQAGNDDCIAPTIVFDFTHEQLGVDMGVIVTLHAFRTTKEAIALCAKQGVNFVNASLWCENHARAYELVAALRCSIFCINSFDVAIGGLQKHSAKKTAFATMDKGYHYETIESADGIQKNVVFPYGTIFAN